MITREVAGGGHSAFFLNDARATAKAKMRARARLNRALCQAVEPIHCPTCGVYQPDMVRVLRERFGKRYEPNKYAADRIAVPVANAWRAACADNTAKSYAKFMDVWPTYSDHAEKQLRQLRYPPHLWKFASAVFWIGWGIVVLFVLGIVIAVL